MASTESTAQTVLALLLWMFPWLFSRENRMRSEKEGGLVLAGTPLILSRPVSGRVSHGNIRETKSGPVVCCARPYSHRWYAVPVLT